jgi:GxxExxY protein
VSISHRLRGFSQMIENYEIEAEWSEVNAPVSIFKNPEILNDLTYKTIGVCFEVYNQLGKGFLEVVYKDAIEFELTKRGILFEREKKYQIKYKETVLKHFYYADFVIEDRLIFEVKAQQVVIDEHYKQVINYLAVSGCKLGLLVNFGENSLKYKRVILTEKN